MKIRKFEACGVLSNIWLFISVLIGLTHFLKEIMYLSAKQLTSLVDSSLIYDISFL